PDYLSPEACLGRSVDERSDLYSMGATLFFALTGRAPFGTATHDVPAVLLKHAYEPAPDVRTLRSDVPAEVAALLERLLAKQPGDRPQSALALAQEIETILVTRFPARASDGAQVQGPRFVIGSGAGAEETTARTERTDRIVVLPALQRAADAGDRSYETLPSPVGKDASTGDGSPLGVQERLLRAGLHLASGRWSLAVQDLEWVVREQPRSQAGWLGLARALAHLPGRDGEARVALQRAVEAGLRRPEAIRKALHGTVLADRVDPTQLLRRPACA
ncbi:MAG: hypothetical protein D6776_07685, partial [Planctomycetota bacterium]